MPALSFGEVSLACICSHYIAAAALELFKSSQLANQSRTSGKRCIMESNPSVGDIPASAVKVEGGREKKNFKKPHACRDVYNLCA